MLNQCDELRGMAELIETAAPDLNFLQIIICGQKEMDFFLPHWSYGDRNTLKVLWNFSILMCEFFFEFYL